MRNLKVSKEEGNILYFKDGWYNRSTGDIEYLEKKLPYFVDKMTHMHKANSGHPLFYLNIFFGASLLFYVISTFWMFVPSTSIFKKCLYYTAGGILLTLLMLII
jgi:hypothetical protein